MGFFAVCGELQNLCVIRAAAAMESVAVVRACPPAGIRRLFLSGRQNDAATAISAKAGCVSAGVASVVALAASARKERRQLMAD